jgi:CheY-like chemotaxis protein
MLQLSSYSHSLLQLYKFRDSKMEERYQADINKWSLYNTQFGYISTAVSQAIPCISYYSILPLPVNFWAHLGIGAVAFAFFLNGLFNSRCRHRTVLIYFIFFIFVTSAFISLMFIEPNLWTRLAYAAWIPEGQHMYVGAGSDADLRLSDSRFLGFLTQAHVQSYWNIMTALIQMPMLHLCLTGLNIWCLLGNSFLLCGVSGMLWCSLQSGSSLIFNCLYLTLLFGSSTALAGLLERIQRQKFLAEMLLEQQMRASETADSILNHTLKNILADVGAYIELFLADRAPRSVLEDALVCLRRGVKACKERQVYLKLVVGTYAPVANAVDLEGFARDLLAGRSVRTSVATGTAHFDQTLLTLILDNALSNAAKYGCPSNPDVTFTVRGLCEDDLDTEPSTFEFAISNAADPQRPPLTTETVAALLSGAPRPQRLGRAPLLSDGIGLAHAKLAADVAGIRISLVQEGPRVVFRAVLDSPEPEDPRRVSAGPSDRYVVNVFKSPDPSSDTMDFDSILPHTSIFVLDDAGSSRRILEQQLRHAFPGVRVTALGAEEDDVELFTAMAAGEAEIVILDQHLEYSGGSYLGTTVAQRLRRLGYRRMICIRSADDSPEDQELYKASGAHCFLGKNLPGREMVRRFAAAYRDFTEVSQ